MAGLELGPPVTLRQAKAAHLKRVLDAHAWNLSGAAKCMGVSRQWVARAIDRWGLSAPAELPAPAPAPAPSDTFKQSSRLHVQQVLDELAWNVTEAARVLGIHRRTLYRVLDRMQLQRPAALS